MGIIVRDKTKNDTYMCATLLNMFRRGDLRKNHPQQRKAERWKCDARDGFIATIIKHEDVDSIKICEQIVGNKVILWLIDGLQRLTNLEKFKNGTFKLGRNLEMPVVYYVKTKYDNDGNIIVDEYGDPVQETAKFDLRGKSYNELPDELKEKFDNYQINVVKQLNCTDEEVGYHIRRYNRQSSMNNNETSITYMDHIARIVKHISQEHSFFKNCGKYTLTEKKNGTIERIVCETLMATYHLDDWQKNGKKMGAYLNEHAEEKEFDSLSQELTRLENIIGENFQEYFNSKDSFIMFALFHEFTKFGIEDSHFKDFLQAFQTELHNKEIENDCSFDEVNKNRATKDKSVVRHKLNILEILLKDYLKIENITGIEEFISECNDIDLENVRKDIDFYNDSLDTLLDETVKIDSRLRDDVNRPSLLALMSYSYKYDVDLEDWLTEYAERNNTYNTDQKENFIHMTQDLQKYLSRSREGGNVA